MTDGTTAALDERGNGTFTFDMMASRWTVRVCGWRVVEVDPIFDQAGIRATGATARLIACKADRLIDRYYRERP